MAAPSLPPPPLDPPPAVKRAWVEAALDRVLHHLEGLDDPPVQQTRGGAELAARLREPALSEQPVELEALLGQLFDDALSVTYNTASGGYLAYVPGGGVFAAAVGDFIADAVNRYVTVWLAAPGLVQLEQNVVAWMAGLFGWSQASGVLLTGGSLANFTAVHTARAERLGDRPTDGVLYTSTEAHHSVLKAAHLAGFAPSAVRTLPTDERFRLDVAALSAAIDEDRRAGRRPFLVVAQGGATNTGAVDPLVEIGEVCARESLWLHVDAAYGGFFQLTGRGRAALAGIERADSITLDPHKGLFLPLGTGALVVRDPGALRRAHEVPGAYMPPMQDDVEHPDFCALSPELSRDFRGLRVWLALKLHGVATFRAALDEKLDLARRAAQEVAALPDVELVSEPTLSLFAFCWQPPGLDGAAVDELNQRWMEAVNARGRVFLTGTRAGGRFLVRMCVLHFRTTPERVQQAIDDLADARAQLAGANGWR